MQKDKILHVVIGFAIGVVASFICVYFGFAKDTSLLIGLGFAAAAGIGKEVYDLKKPETHTAEAADAWHTIGGGAVGAIVGALMLPFVL